MAKKKESQEVVNELRERPDGELRSLLASKAEELHKVKFKLALGQLRTTHEVQQIKRDVARINTILSERKHKQAEPTATAKAPAAKKKASKKKAGSAA